MTKAPLNVLFLCTHNSARSIIAEAVMNKLGAGRFKAYSAGSQPSGRVHPYALDMLGKIGYDISNMRSKSWEEFTAPDAPQLDFVFTVCDNAAGETCPVWPGQPMTAHWGIEDPAAVKGSDIQKEAAFVAAFRYMKNRISAFSALPVSSLDKASLRAKLLEIGQSDGTSSPRNSAA